VASPAQANPARARQLPVIGASMGSFGR